VSQEVEKRISETSSASTEEVSDQASEEASEETTEESEVEEVLDSLEVEDAAIVNNNESSSDGESLRDRFAKTFKESVKISY
jgi:hypothetical protein